MHAPPIKKWLKFSSLAQPSILLQSSLSSLLDFPGPNSGGRFIPDHPILPLLAAAHRHHHQVDLRSLHAHIITSGLIRDPFAASRVVQFYLWPPPAGDLRYASAIFDSIDRPDVYTWNAMIAGHTVHGLPGSAVSCYFRMRASRAPPNAYTFALLVKACTAAGGAHIGLEREVHGQVLKCGIEGFIVVKNSLLTMYCNVGLLGEARLLFDRSPHLDLISWNTLISAYGKNGDLGTARELFEKMPDRNLVSWSALIDGCVRNGDFSEALTVFDRLQASRIKPDTVTLVSVLKACAHLGMLDQGRWIHRYIERNALDRDGNVVVATALVELYSKCGCIDEALEVFDRVRDGDVVLWNSMIGGLGMHGHGCHALELFERMKEQEIPPNGVTFVGVLCACAHTGMVDEGIKIFESMREHGIEPRREHYGCVADVLGRAGRVQEAEDVLLRMPMEPEAPQWGALMSACRTHSDTDVGERVGKCLISTEPNDAGRYILLSNVYAAAGRWDDMRGTRREMEEKGVRKETGLSFVESKVIHEFSPSGSSSSLEQRDPCHVWRRK